MNGITENDSQLIEEAEENERIVLSQEEHPILEKDIETEALKVLYRLRDAGYSGYLVGGGVRDLYLGNKPKDFDISTNARPGQLRKLFRNSRTIGRRFRLVQVFFKGNKIIEVSTLRSQSEFDSDEPDKVLPANNTFGTLEEDAFRRDLTINSLFYEIENKTVIDYVGGVKDLTDGIIRIVGEPEQRIIRDPVRMLRAIRHAARNGFSIEEKTFEAISNHVEKLDLCPTSRIRDELLKDLRSGASKAWAELALQTGVFSTLFPFYDALFQDKDVGGTVQEELLAMLRALDAIYLQGKEKGRVLLEDAFLFAILLFPWALRQFDLLNQDLKGAGYHRLSKAIRTELDTVFARRLNLKRAIKDKITTLFVNMSSLQKHRKNDTWPAWLRKKSYFQDCSRFYTLYQEAIAGETVTDLKQFIEESPKPAQEAQEAPPLLASVISAQTEDKRSGGGRRGNNPAFSTEKHGVFGLLKG
ncbi:MAG: polynucleotide adenylyltransferase PcnB [Candidatus Electrothrix aestuarii]|uniref:Polynucleotide adenylyltransferase PcnB n=1 Tax=Candidatus Electrothrix aestuarii TaxID=3062594 RepID=A0AAU8LR58_9BACT|nr:polynucleotide adenylyltransferase PcnB [Candidatus Electrothrix aestuarii]